MLKEFDSDTIVAISTPLGEGGIGVIRLSGREAVDIADSIFQSKNGTAVSQQKSFTVQLGHVVSRENGSAPKRIDEVLLCVMRAPKSYTCEDVVEISAHGGPAVLQAILDLAVRAGARLAARGEFTKRAFLNGRIDLLQAEAVLDLVRVKTELGRKWAAAQLEGVLSKKMTAVKRELLDILSHLEASIDFPDDFPETQTLPEIGNRLESLKKEIQPLLAQIQTGLLVSLGLKVVIAGRPNVGKSSLMNALVKLNRVIVNPYPGTTRDVVSEEIQIKGFPVRLFDTAGIQDTENPIEKEGIEFSKKAVRDADLVLFVIDGSEGLHPPEEELFHSLEDKKKILVINKSDLPQKKIPLRFEHSVKTSCVKDSGVESLEETIFLFMTQDRTEFSEEAVLGTVRQKDLLEKLFQNIEDARTACGKNLSQELIAVDIRLALDEAGKMVGEVVTDEMLDVLFNQFCIGK